MDQNDQKYNGVVCECPFRSPCILKSILL